MITCRLEYSECVCILDLCADGVKERKITTASLSLCLSINVDHLLRLGEDELLPAAPCFLLDAAEMALTLERWVSGTRADVLAPFEVCWVALDWLGAPATPELIFMA